jgi:SAM-dependent methyltransferase
LYGCFVAGIDLAPRSVAVARLLAQRTGVSPSVSYRVGDARVLPFLDGLFDLVWSQLVAMEIEEREALYAEFHRVLRPGGRLALHDVVAGDAGPPLYPTLWAESADASHLLTEGETRHALASVGLRLVRLHDETGAALAVVARAQAPGSAEGAAGVLGPGSPAMAANLAQNLREGRLKVIMAVAEAAP